MSWYGGDGDAFGDLQESALRAVEPKDYEGNDKFNSFYEGVQMMESVFLKGLRENNVRGTGGGDDALGDAIL